MNQCKADLLTLFQQLLPFQFFWATLKQAKVRENNRVYSSRVVVWLMIFASQLVCFECDKPVGTRGATWGRLKMLYR